MRPTLFLLFASLLPVLPAGGAAAELRILSAGAVEPGLEAAVAAFRQASRQDVVIAYATAPQLRERLGGGETPDVVIAPVSVLREFSAAGRLAGAPVPLGQVGVGVVTRADAPAPDIRDAAGLALAVRQASMVVFNRASTGLHMDRLFERLELTAAVTPKAARYATGAAVLEHLRRGQGPEIGFAAITEILLVPQLRYVGPLPPGLQNHTSYAASLLPSSSATAGPLLRHLASDAGRAAFTAAGIEAPPP